MAMAGAEEEDKELDHCSGADDVLAVLGESVRLRG